jgi:hypothetical protein
VESVEIPILEASTRAPAGTTIKVSNLSRRFGRREVTRLARSLLLLSDPFDNQVGFKPVLVTPGYRDLERRVARGYFDEATFHVRAELGEDGQARAVARDTSRRVVFEARHGELSQNGYRPAVRATLDLWVFLLDAQQFTSRAVTIGEVREWLEVVGGVHVYRRGLRVQPYGDLGDDWLGMNLARARSPEFRPSTNTAIGRLVVLEPSDRLLEKTDRTGFVENDAFVEVRRFASDVLDWLAQERLRRRERERRRKRVRDRRVVDEAKEAMELAVAALPPKTRREIAVRLKTLERARDSEVSGLRQEVLLYRSLATVGTTTAMFAHDAAKPMSQIKSMATRLETRGRRVAGAAYEDSLAGPIELIRKSDSAVSSTARQAARSDP